MNTVSIRVQKRDGSLVDYDGAEVAAASADAARGLDDGLPRAVQLRSEVEITLFDRISTDQLDDAVIHVALANVKDDPAYADKAAHISALARDLSEWLPELATALQGRVSPPAGMLAFHPPCTLQHGQQLRGGVEAHLGALGFQVQVARTESHLCCGSAGTYSVLQPELAYPLRDRKLGHLQALVPEAILSANIGCITHLQSGTATPVKHWVEVLDAALLPN